jgi:hypothetical protein
MSVLAIVAVRGMHVPPAASRRSRDAGNIVRREDRKLLLIDRPVNE